MSDFNLSDPAIIAAISEALSQAGVDGIEIERGQEKLRIVVEHNGAASVIVDAAKTAQTNTAKAPLAGMFQPASGASPREVAAGEILGFIRVGPVLLPVKAPQAGVLTRALAEKDVLVGYGDPLFEIELHP